MWIPLVMLAIVAAFFWWPGQPGRTGTDPAMDIARRRLAAGEISHEEFERLRQQLEVGGGAGSAPPRLVLALLAGLLLIALASSIAWAWQADEWDWGWDGMGGMMGRRDRPPPATVLNTDDAQVTVRIRDYAYDPLRLEISAGAQVTWTNADSVPHSATAAGEEWDTGLFGRGESRSLMFDRAGAFSYYCSVHPAMVASVIVRP